jgi:hypothetical protein
MKNYFWAPDVSDYVLFIERLHPIMRYIYREKLDWGTLGKQIFEMSFEMFIEGNHTYLN